MRILKYSVLIGFLFSYSLGSAQFVVNNPGNQGDSNAGDGVCNNGSGFCTLRAAIEEANALPGFNTINFEATLIGQTIGIDQHFEINGADGVIINGDIDGDFLPDISIDGGNVGLIAAFHILSANNILRGVNIVDVPNGPGVLIDGPAATNNEVSGCYIGTDLTGTVNGAPNQIGIRIETDANNNTIGNSAFGFNVISGNSTGISIESATDNRIYASIIGLDQNGVADLPNLSQGISLLDAVNTIIGGVGEGNFIAGNNQEGILIDNSTGTIVSGNSIGLDLTGGSAIGNGAAGINITNGSDGTLIGVGIAGGGNTISGNAAQGINIESSNITVLANTIGLDPAGTNPIPNTSHGIWIRVGASNVNIGNENADGRNIISRNGVHGLLVSEGSNLIRGNYIGLGSDGSTLLGNNGIGVFLASGTDNIVGGNLAGEGNVIAGNSVGISISTATNKIYGNIIGLDATATAVKPNSGEGIRLTANAVANDIGDGTPAGANIISGNGSDGVLISGPLVNGNAVNMNYIGTNTSGDNLGNGQAGVRLEAGTRVNSIPQNTIAYNQTGISADGITTQNNFWTQNSIYSNTTGITISPASAQGGVLPPVISTVPIDGMITGTSAPGAAVEIYADAAGQGEYLFGVAADPLGNWTCTCLGPLSSIPGGLNNITAIQTDGANSSAFSTPFPIPVPAPFITTWSTTDNLITVPTFGGDSYFYDVYWEEIGVPTHFGTLTGQTGDAIIDVDFGGDYRVEISGIFPRIYFNNGGDKDDILTVEQWGDQIWTSMGSAFNGCTNLTVPAIDAPDLSGVTDMTSMFQGATSFNNPINHWVVDNVVIMQNLFFDCDIFNQDLNLWNVGNVTDMSGTFSRAAAFNGDISNWDVSSVTNFFNMFNAASSFNQPLNWTINTTPAAAINMRAMFQSTPFNQDLNLWNMSEVVNTRSMFRLTSAFNGNIDNWDVSKVTDMGAMFLGAASFNRNISAWDVSSVQSMNSLFQDAVLFNQDLSAWNNRLGSVTDMDYIFSGALAFNGNISGWVVTSVVSLQGSFANTTNFNRSLSSWDVSNVADMRSTFGNASGFDQSLGNWDISSVTAMDFMLNNSGMSSSSYDATLIGWQALATTPTGINLDAVGVAYCLAGSARAALVAINLWTINDAGQNCNFIVATNPVAHANNIAVTSTISLDFNADVDLLSVHNNSSNANEVYDDNIIIRGNKTGQLEGTFALGGDNSIVVFTPSISFKAGEKISVTINNSVLGAGGEITAPRSFSFIAASGPYEGTFKESITAGISGVVNGAIEWGDYDNDGDIDLAAVGFDFDYNYAAKIFNNSGGVFTDIGAPLEGVIYSSCDWGDFDGDGDLDLAIAGLDAGNSRIVKIYENNAGVFTDILASLQGVDYASIDWGDYDNDGDLDLAVLGRYSFSPDQNSTTIYQNNGGSFTDIGAGLIGLSNGSADWVDYDTDGDLDLFVTGADESSIRYAIVYRNDGGNVFVDGGEGLPGVEFSAADWGDYDNDGDLDLVMMGGQSIGPNDGVYIYQNNAGVFSDIGAGFSNEFEDGSARWADFDGDGDLDLGLTGQDYVLGDYAAYIYRNDAGTFVNIGVPLFGVAGHAKGEWGDFDGDGDLDFLTTGEDNENFEVIARLYENTVFNAFVTTWQTDNPGGTSNDDQITIPTIGAGYNYDIYWEEVGNPTNNGTEPAGQTGDYTITFPSPGQYRVEITGDFPRIYFNAASFNPDKDSHKLLTVEQWGDIAWTSMSAAFSGCINLQINASDAPNLSGVTSMFRMFYDASSLNSNINNWDVSTISDMSELFRDADNFNQPLDNWDVSNVTNMFRMFSFAPLFNQDISAWDVSNVQNMNSMFAAATSFNQPLGSWDVSTVTGMGSMFSIATSFNQDISTWDVSNVTDIRSMFNGATIFNQDITGWTVNATSFANLFRNAEAFNQDISGWDVSAVTDMEGMFSGAIAFNQTLSTWNVSNVQSMADMFSFTTYNQDITGWNVSTVQDFNAMFAANSAFNQNISSWDVTNARDMRNMFSNATSFNQDLSGWNVINLRFAVNMLNSSGLSIANYDNLLAGWAGLTLQSNVSFGAQGLFYCASATPRAELIANFTWFITDSGLGCISVFEGTDVSGNEVLNAQPTPINLGSGLQGVGKTVQFTIQNELANDITTLAITASGTAFSITQPATIISTGSTLTFDVVLTTSAATGNYAETISIVSDQFTTPFVFDITAEVTATPEPEIEIFDGLTNSDPLLPDGDIIGLQMGSEPRGTDLVDVITITNIGSADLNITALDILDPAFTLDVTAPLTIPVGGEQNVFITLDGTLGLSYFSNLSITSNDTDETVYDFPVRGTILGPDINVYDGPDRFSPEIFDGQAAPLDIGASNEGTDLTYQITVLNYNPVDLDISSISISGTSFTLSPTSPIILNAEIDAIFDSFQLTITLDGSTLGVFTETISIVSDDDDEPIFDFQVTGSIVAPPHIYWTENIGDAFNDDEIHRTDLDGNDFSRYYSGFADEISGLVIDTAANRLYWTDAAQAEIITGEIGAGGLASGPTVLVDYNPGSAGGLYDLALDLANGHIYFTYANAETGFTNKIVRVNLDGTNPIELIDLGFEEPFGIDLDLTNNKIYFTTNLTATDQDSRLYRSDLNGSNLEQLVYTSTSIVNPVYFRDVEVDLTNNVVYWATGEEDLPGAIYYNVLTEAAPYSAPASFTTTGEIRGLDLDPINSKLYWMCRGASNGTVPAAVMRSNLDGTVKESVFTVTLYPTNYPTDPAGSSFIALDLRGLVSCLTPPTADAGLDQTVCEGNVINLNGVIGGAASTLTWSTSGDGTFDNNTSASAQYTPGTNDITNGSVTITITSDDPDGPGLCLPASDDLIITIGPQPTVSVDSDFTICEGDAANVNAVIGGSASTLTWTTSGDGTFDNSNNLTANYTPGTTDVSTGTVTLIATTDDPDGAGSCIAASSSLVVSIDATPTVDAGVDQAVCANELVTLSGTLGGSALSATWSSTGDGSFDDINSLTADYTLGTSDIATGTVTLTLTSVATAACISVSDPLTIAISQPIAVVDQSATQNVGETSIIDPTLGGSFNTGDVLTTTLLILPTKGSATINADGTISYTSNEGNGGTDSFEFEVCNQCGLCSAGLATINLTNEPPEVDIPPANGQPGGVVTVDVLSGITDKNGNIDLSSLKVIVQPTSGANAFFDTDGNLTVDYTGIDFVGTDQLTIEICDFDGLCTSEIITIEIAVPKVIVYNAVSPNGDGKHDYLELENVEFFPANTVVILNRWGDIVFEMDGYDNIANVFEGNSNRGGNGELPSGTYFYKIDLKDGSPVINGFFTLRK